MASVTPRKRSRKSELGNQLGCLGRDLGTAALVFHQTVADRLGLNPTDHKCLDLLHHATDPTAGDLADWTGLTTGAVTGVIDRLERRGFVRREAHPNDRRKVMIRTNPERYNDVVALFAGLAEKMGTLAAGYTETELAIITGHMARSAEIFRAETKLLRESSGERRT